MDQVSRSYDIGAEGDAGRTHWRDEECAKRGCVEVKREEKVRAAVSKVETEVADLPEVEVFVATDSADLTIARVEFGKFKQSAMARRDPADAYFEGVGVKLAIGRALRDLGKQLTRDAMRQVNP